MVEIRSHAGPACSSQVKIGHTLRRLGDPPWPCGPLDLEVFEHRQAEQVEVFQAAVRHLQSGHSRGTDTLLPQPGGGERVWTQDRVNNDHRGCGAVVAAEGVGLAEVGVTKMAAGERFQVAGAAP